MGTVGLRSRRTLYEPLALRPDHGDFCLPPSTRVEMQLSGDTLTGGVRVRPLLSCAGLRAGAHHLLRLVDRCADRGLTTGTHATMARSTTPTC